MEGEIYGSGTVDGLITLPETEAEGQSYRGSVKVVLRAAAIASGASDIDGRPTEQGCLDKPHGQRCMAGVLRREHRPHLARQPIGPGSMLDMAALAS